MGIVLRRAVAGPGLSPRPAESATGSSLDRWPAIKRAHIYRTEWIRASGSRQRFPKKLPARGLRWGFALSGSKCRGDLFEPGDWGLTGAVESRDMTTSEREEARAIVEGQGVYRMLSEDERQRSTVHRMRAALDHIDECHATLAIAARVIADCHELAGPEIVALLTAIATTLEE